MKTDHRYRDALTALDKAQKEIEELRRQNRELRKERKEQQKMPNSAPADWRILNNDSPKPGVLKNG